MTIIHRARMKRKTSGGRYHPIGRKRIYETGSAPSLTTTGKQRIKTKNTKSGTPKTKVYAAETINCLDPKTKKFLKAKVTSVIENAANRHYIRRNIITKGAIVETDKGKARITSRPGQHGTINAVLVQ